MGDGQNLPEMILGSIKYQQKSGGLRVFLGGSGGSFKEIVGRLVRISSCNRSVGLFEK
jgi:hypothetical protein